MDVQQHAVSVGSVCTACGVSQILQTQRQVDVASSSAWPGTSEFVVSVCHGLSERLNTRFINSGIKSDFVTWKSPTLFWRRPGLPHSHQACER